VSDHTDAGECFRRKASVGTKDGPGESERDRAKRLQVAPLDRASLEHLLVADLEVAGGSRTIG